MLEFFTVYLPLAIIISVAFFFLYMNRQNANARKNRGKNADYLESEADAQTDYARLIRLFEMLSKFPLTSKGTNQLHELLAGLGVYTIVEQRVETARLIVTSYIILLASVVLIYFISGDLIVRVGAILIAIIFRRDFINKKLRKERVAVWEDTYRSMASLKNEWERVFSLQKAFNKAVIEDRSKMAFSSVTALFKTKNPSADLAFFNQNNPNQIMQRFADLCYNTYYYGVEISRNSGVDTFISNLDVIMRDLQVEIDLAKGEKKKFYTAEKLPIIAMGIVALAPGFLTSRYPGLEYHFSGAFGYIAMIVCILAIAIIYHFVANINDRDRPIDDTFDFEIYLFMKPKFKDFWQRRVGKYNLPKQELLRESLSYLTEEQLKFRQVYISALTGVVVLTLTILYVYLVGQSHLVNLSQLPEETMEVIKTNYDSPDEFAKKYVLDESITTPEQMKSALEGENLNANETTIEVVTNILMANKEGYENAKYSPLLLFLVLIAMMVSSQVPIWMLERRKGLVEVEIDFEVLVLYAVTVQMMYMPLKLRDYLKRFTYLSKLYPKTHLDCWIHQFNNPIFIKESALKMNNPHYYDLMERLYTLHSARLSVDVFREIERKREYMFNQVLKAREERYAKNYNILRICVFGILIAVITLQVIIPIAIFSMQAFEQYGGFM